MMYSVSSKKQNYNTPELSQREKLEQIRSGKQLKRTKSGLQKRSVVVRGNDGAKIIKNQTEEKFEESGVTKKKRNYIMYESKLSTEKNTQITEIKKKPVRQKSPRIEDKIVIKKKRKEYLDNYQYHETKDLKENNPKFQSVVEHKRLGDIIGGFYDETIVEHSRYSTGTYQPKREPTIYSTKTTVIRTPYKPLQATYKPLKTPYKPMRTTTTHKRLQTPYAPSRNSFVSSQTTSILPSHQTILPSYQTIETSSFSSTKPSYRPAVTPYQPIHKTIKPSYRPAVTPYQPIHKTIKPSRKTPYHELRQHNTDIFREINTSRIGAKTPRYNSKPVNQISRNYNDNYDYSSQTYHVKKPNNAITRRTDNVLNYIKSVRGKTPQTYDTKKEENSIISYKKRDQPTPQNLYENKYQTKTSKTTITKVFLKKTGSFTEDEPIDRFEDDTYGTKTITTVSKISKTIEDENDRIPSKQLQNYSIENGRNNQNENSRVEIKIEKRTEIHNDGSYGKGPSIRNKYKRKKK